MANIVAITRQMIMGLRVLMARCDGILADEARCGHAKTTMWSPAVTGKGGLYPPRRPGALGCESACHGWRRRREPGYGGTGADYIDYSLSHNDDVLYGDNPSYSVYDGSDYIVGGFRNDTIHGGGGTDYLYGRDGDDLIFGDQGNDYVYGGNGIDQIYGGEGNDTIDGGAGYDYMWGGSGVDTFVFHNGDTGPDYATCDKIFDFNRAYDWIDGDVAGTSSNFIARNMDTSFWGAGFDNAAQYADAIMVTYGVTYAFVSDGTNGYLLADYDRTNDQYGNRVDAGVELHGITTTNNTLYYSDIIWGQR
jgi:hemolysin type calcium-binding protein